MTEIKNILLIGRTGNGKSTLANVISETDKFKESAGSVSETRGIQAEEFRDNITRDGSQTIRYRIIDTVGIGDTQLTPREVLRRIQEGSKYIETGLSQILFVTNGRFTEEERNAYNLLRSVIFDNEVVRYTTIIRTNFPEFENENACERDRVAIRNENKEQFDIINAVKIIYVDNPPINTGNIRRDSVNIETREISRERLLALLGTFQGNYRPKNLAEMSERISDYRTEKEKLEEELREKDRMMREQEEKFQEKIDNLHSEQDKKFEKFREDYEQKVKEAQDRSDQQIKDARDQGKLTEKLMEQIEMNRREAEERARRDREESERKASSALKEKEESLRREAEDKRKISELEAEKKLRALEDQRKEDNKRWEARIEYIENNYRKKPKCIVS